MENKFVDQELLTPGEPPTESLSKHSWEINYRSADQLDNTKHESLAGHQTEIKELKAKVEYRLQR